MINLDHSRGVSCLASRDRIALYHAINRTEDAFQLVVPIKILQAAQTKQVQKRLRSPPVGSLSRFPLDLSDELTAASKSKTDGYAAALTSNQLTLINLTTAA